MNPPTYSDSPPVGTTNVIDRFVIGDMVIVNFSGVDPQLLPPREELIKEDGTITTWSKIGPVQAAGRTPLELQNELQQLYNKYYNNLTVTVKTSERRVYYVSGEVVHPGAVTYLGETTVTKAVAAAGGFTEYANKTVLLTRPNGEKRWINCKAAELDPSKDASVFPGDKIHVRRRLI